jgi:prepilin-type processing-associated H-X9-DG protein
MQYRLSTLFLIFFMVAASLALIGPWGLLIAAILLLAALFLNRMESLEYAIAISVFIILFGTICRGLLPVFSSAHEAAWYSRCKGHLEQIGVALHNYHDAFKHFPLVNHSDKNGKPLYSWQMEILPMMEYGYIYDLLKKDEPWNSPYNLKLLSKVPPLLYNCPSSDEKKSITNYIAVIGPGTAWRRDRAVKLSDLPDSGSHTVMVVEVVNSIVHWLEPCDLSEEEVLERMKTGKGLRISTAHPDGINVLFADGTVRTLPSKMPISLWKRILSGEGTDFDKLVENVDESAPDIVDVSLLPLNPDKWKIILGAIVWLLSVVLLFWQAIKSRRKCELIEMAKDISIEESQNKNVV